MTFYGAEKSVAPLGLGLSVCLIPGVSSPFGDSTAGLCSYAPLGLLSRSLHTIFWFATDPTGRQIIARGFIPWLEINHYLKPQRGDSNEAYGIMTPVPAFASLTDYGNTHFRLKKCSHHTYFRLKKCSHHTHFRLKKCSHHTHFRLKKCNFTSERVKNWILQKNRKNNLENGFLILPMKQISEFAVFSSQLYFLLRITNAGSPVTP